VTVNWLDLPGASLLLHGDAHMASPDGPWPWRGLFTHVDPLYLRNNGITSDCA
jgi:hypothetical protein